MWLVVRLLLGASVSETLRISVSVMSELPEEEWWELKCCHAMSERVKRVVHMQNYSFRSKHMCVQTRGMATALIE